MPCKGKSKEFIATAKKMCRKEKNTVWNKNTCKCVDAKNVTKAGIKEAIGGSLLGLVKSAATK